MGARRVQGDFMLNNGYTVATGQPVDTYDLVGYPQAGPAWSASIAYVPGQMVTVASINYICIAATTNNTPPNATYWAVLTNNSIIRASDLSTSWCTAVTTATIVCTDTGTSVGTGAPYTNSATGFKISYNFPWGEGTLSGAVTATPTAHAGIYITGLNPPWPALSTNLYIETAAGSGVYKLHSVHSADTYIAYTYGAGRIPPAAAASQSATTLSQYVFAQMFAGVSNQRMPTSGPPAIFGTPTRPFGNSSDNQIMICRGGVFEFDCASASFAAGTYVAPAKASGNALLNQTVVAVAGPALAIGKVFDDVTSSVKVMVEVTSRYRPTIPTPGTQEY